MISFHGGCAGCTQQEKHGVDFCYDCRFFDARWEKENLNNRPETTAERVRNEVILMRGDVKRRRKVMDRLNTWMRRWQ